MEIFHSDRLLAWATMDPNKRLGCVYSTFQICLCHGQTKSIELHCESLKGYCWIITLLQSLSAGSPCWTMACSIKELTAESMTSLLTPPWVRRCISFSLLYQASLTCSNRGMILVSSPHLDREFNLKCETFIHNKVILNVSSGLPYKRMRVQHCSDQSGSWPWMASNKDEAVRHAVIFSMGLWMWYCGYTS